MAVAAQPMAQGRDTIVTTPNFIGHHIPCPLCKSEDLVCIGTHDRRGDALKTDLCRACGHVFTNPQPTQSELNAYYRERYRASYKGVVTPKQKHVYRAGLRALERLTRLAPHTHLGERVLDIGAGGGEFVYLAGRHGLIGQGIEPNRGYAEYAANEYEIPITIGTIEEATNADAPWQVITLHHVLEHLSNPVAALQKLSEMLANDGLINVEVPNVLARYHGPKRRFHFAHLHTFSASGLTLAARKAGLRVENMMVQPHTGHLNAIFKFSKQEPAATDAITAGIIEQHLAADTPTRDLFTTRPYKRLWANLKRPIKERVALAQLGAPQSPKDILDRLYENTDLPEMA